MLRSPKHLALKTYQAGLLQSKAHRALTAFMTAQLAKHNLSLPQWAALGVLSEETEVSPSTIAGILGVKPPVATKVLNELVHKRLLKRTKHERDHRAAVLHLTAEGIALVGVVEQQLRKELRIYLADIKISELMTYIQVLNKIAAKYG